MTRRLVTRGLAIAAATTTLLAGGLAAQAAAPDSSTDDARPAVDKLAPGLLNAMERDLGLDAESAKARLAFQDEAADIGATLERSLGADFAGAWVDEDTDVLYVATTDAADVAAVEAAGATPVTADHALTDLETWKAALDQALADNPRITGWHVDVTTNKVVVQTKRGADRAAQRLAARAGVPAGAVETVVSDETPRTFIDVVGGNAYYTSAGSRCSVGFSVNGGFVTAGHCGRTGTTTTSPSGSFAGSSFPGNDYAFVRVNAGNTMVGAVNNYSGGRVAVAGATAAPVGSSVCRSGSTTGWHCGTIQALNSTVTYAEGTVTGLIRTNVCAEPGDSGGSLIAGNQAQGVTSGGSGNCRTGGTTYFQPVGEILSAYGLTLVTSDGGGGEPQPPADCTGYARSYTGSLSSGATSVQPNGSYFTVNRSGQHRACLAGPSGSDFDLYLQRWNGWSWQTVAQGTSPGASETLTYSGSSGYYRYVVHAYSGSGSYRLGVTTP